MAINLTDELNAATKKGKIASAKQVYLEGDQENLQQIGDKTHQLEQSIKDISTTGGASTANAVSYNNETSGMTAVNAQAAIDELAAKNKAQDATIATKADAADVTSKMQTEQTRVNEELDKKFDKSNIAQELGDSEENVVSQFALPFREIESPEFIKVIVDAEDHVLFGIQLDGSIEWSKGIPAPIRAKLQEIINQSQQDKTDLLEALNTVKEELSTSITELQQNKVDKKEGKSLIDDEVKECFKVIENEEFIHAITDSEDRLLFGIYRETGKPYLPLNDMYHVEQNEEYFAVWLDAENHVLFGIRRDGQIIGEIHAVNALKQVISQLQSDLTTLQEKVDTIDNTNLQELISVFSLQENPEYLAVETDAEDKVLAYRDKQGTKHEHSLQVTHFFQNGKELNIAEKKDLEEMKLADLDGVVDYSLENLFNKEGIRTYDSDFATKVYQAIGRKTAETGCYSNDIPCKEGDWFTRNDFGTGIVVVLDKDKNILGDVKNVAYKPTFQIKASDGQDFSTARYVVMVVMLNALDSEKIVKAKYVTAKMEDTIRIPKLRISQENIELGITTYIESNNGRYYSLSVDDSLETPQLKLIKMDGIPMSMLPSDFPRLTISGDFSKYYKSLVMCPIEGGTEYLFELGSNGLVTRYLKQKVNCPRILKEEDTQYYYGVDGTLNYSSGKLNIFKAKNSSFELVKGNITDSEGNDLEPHDCLVLSVTPLHFICQRYIANIVTTVDGVSKIVTALHVEEVYDGKKVWLWKSEDYPELWKDSHYQNENADYLHNNTINIDKDGNLILNNKHANQILVIKRSWDDSTQKGNIGEILWKIGGNHSKDSYNVESRIMTSSSQQWFECHDAEVSKEGVFTLFDNQHDTISSRIIEFKIDTVNKVLKDFSENTYKTYRGRFMGSVDKIADGIYLVSWGSSRGSGTPNIGIYDFANNKILFELKFDSDSYSTYRVYGIKNV